MGYQPSQSSFDAVGTADQPIGTRNDILTRSRHDSRGERSPLPADRCLSVGDRGAGYVASPLPETYEAAAPEEQRRYEPS